MCRCGIRIPSARNRCLAFAKDKYLEPMFDDVGQPEQKPLCCWCWLLQPQAILAQNPMLYACASTSPIYFSVIFDANNFIYLKKVKAINFINCQGVKSTCNKSKLSNRKTTANKKSFLKLQVESHTAKSFTNCQVEKRACNKSKLSNRKTIANKIQFEIKNLKSYHSEFYNLSNCTINLQ